MGLLGGLGNVLGDVLNGKSVDFLAVASQVFNNAGGLNGILAQLEQAGLGEHVQSWIGTGSNMPISAEQITNALSSGQLQQLAQSFGIDIDQLGPLLAQHLPHAVDQASPGGILPS